ncbi:MAG: mannose-1-phosphate guanyltransferase, partial [Actinomycetia bacterium]|nr:mannose-1-phosphate guanyltransferase [Actinomycetes bacterium]
MEYIIELLKENGCKDIIVTLQFLPRIIKRYFSNGQEMGVNISYVTEEVPLGTAGSVKNAEKHLSGRFIVISGDALTDFNLRKFIDFHKKRKAFVTIALKKVTNPLDYGIVITDKSGRVEKFLEKPGWGEVFSDTVNTGIYIIEPEVLKYVPEGKPFDFSKDLFPILLEEGKPIYGCVMDGYWCDIGNVKAYMGASKDFIDRKLKFEPEGIKTIEDVWLGEGTQFDPEIKLLGSSVIGQHVKIESGATIGKYSVIGDNVIIKSGAHVHRAIVMDNSFIGSNSTLRNCIIGRNCDIRKGVRIGERVVIGDECVIGEDSIINHDVKIYPFKTVENGATINTSLIWESRGIRRLFGKQGISGLINIDITSQHALRIAMAYGSSLPQNATVAVGRDISAGSRMIKRVIIAGLSGTGVNVKDLRINPPPVIRHSIRSRSYRGGIQVSTLPFDPQSLEIKVFNEKGIDLSIGERKKVERFYFREEFRRAFYNEIGNISYPTRAIEFYVSDLIKEIDSEAIKKTDMKLVVDHAHGACSYILPHLMGRLKTNFISLNASTAERRSTLTMEELEGSLKQVSNSIKVFKADFGILIGSSCEKIILLDEKGRRLSPDTLLHLFIKLVSEYEKRKGKIV